MIKGNPQMTALALLVRKFGKRIEGGGFEVEINYEEVGSMSPHGVFQEVPSVDRRVVKWQYFPNHTIDAQISVSSESVTELSEEENGKEQLRDSTGG